MNRLKELRKSKSKTIAEVSNETGISKTSLTNYENEKRFPRDQKVWDKLADYYGVSPAYVMGISDLKKEHFSPEAIGDALNSYDDGIYAYNRFKKLYSETLIRNSQLNLDSEKISDTIFAVINSLNLIFTLEDESEVITILDTYRSISYELLNLISMYSKEDPDHIDQYIDNETYTIDFLRSKEKINKSLDIIFEQLFLKDLD